MACVLAACASVTGNDRPRISVAEAERAFAADAQTRTVHEAFVTNFARDAIMFRPTPVNAQESLAARPIPATALLRWTPAIAETSAAGDLAVSTGPSENGTRGQPPSGTGYFLSVWRAMGGKWRVVFDAGIDAPISGPVDMQGGTISLRTLRPSPTRSDDLEQMRQDLMHTERLLITDYPNLLREHATSDLRRYRKGRAPTSTIGEAIGLVSSDADVEWTPQAAFVAASGDLGYVYGVAKTDRERGYVRIWRNQDGSWKVAYDLR
jgi:ketosteroid isomerase-like protein